MIRTGITVTSLKRLALLKRVVSVFIFICSLFVFTYYNASAEELFQRSIEINSSLPSATTRHEFQFTTRTSAAIGSIVFEYCTNAPYSTFTCDAPAGLIVSSATIISQVGITGMSVSGSNSTANKLVITRPASGTTPITVRYIFSNIINQSSANQSVYVRISTHGSTDGSGPSVDSGAVVYSTTEGVGVGGFVPPRLTFCVGVTVAENCTSTSGSLIGLGELSKVRANSGTSQFSASTNDPTGLNIFVSGGTITSGNNVITPLANNAPSIPGSSQFGINLRLNPSIGTGANQTGSGTIAPTSPYNNSDSFRYNDGELIAKSDLSTNFNKFTVTYMVNVADSQPPGIYSSSFTYTAVASF